MCALPAEQKATHPPRDMYQHYAADAERKQFHYDSNDGDNEAALIRESARVVRAVKAPLDRVLLLREYQRRGPLQSFRPELHLNFSSLLAGKHGRTTAKIAADHGLSPKRVARALQALTAVLVHLLRLQGAKPGLQSAFLMQLFASIAMRTPVKQTRSYLTWMAGETDLSPRRVLLIFDNPSEKQLDAVAEFFTRQRGEPHGWRKATTYVLFSRLELRPPSQEELLAFSNCEIGLSFEAPMLSEPSLRRIQSLLTQIAATDSTTHLCGIDLLTLGTQGLRSMQPGQLEIVAEMLSENHIYQLCDINLQGIVNLFTRNDLRAGLLNIIRSTFRVNNAAAQDSGPARKLKRSGMPRRSISLARIPLSSGHIAAICSSLRYGCAYDEISLATVFKHIDAAVDRVGCWRWLAFGLFYPRSKRFAAAFRLHTIDLSGSFLSNVGMKAFSGALTDPVAELRGTHDVHVQGRGEIIVCELTRGSVIYPEPDVASKPLRILDQVQSWEALYSPVDTEWLNVVVPGHGLGWVQSCNITARLKQTLAETEPLGLILNGFDVFRATDALNVFMASVGHRLQSLEFISSMGNGMSTIFRHCTRLQHLNLEFNDLSTIYMPQFIKFLQSPAARQLTSLNINNARLGDAGIRWLAEVLKNPRCLPRLEELRVKDSEITEDGLKSLKAALRINRTLVVVELQQSFSRKFEAEFGASFDNKRVYVPTPPLVHKLALISAIDAVNTSGTGKITDRWVWQQIFDFAGHQVERKIFWSK